MDLLKGLVELEKVFIFPSVSFESLGSDEWCYSFEIRYIPKEFWEEKRRLAHMAYIQSFYAQGSYVGGYDTYEEAWTECFKRIKSDPKIKLNLNI